MITALTTNKESYLPLWPMPRATLWLLEPKTKRESGVVEVALEDFLDGHLPVGLMGNQFESQARRTQREACLNELRESASKLRVLFDALEEGGVPQQCYRAELVQHPKGHERYSPTDIISPTGSVSLGLVPYLGVETGYDGGFEPNEAVLKLLTRSARIAIEGSGAAKLLELTVVVGNQYEVRPSSVT